MVTHQELVEYLTANRDTYRFLSQMLFKELNEEAIEILASEEWPAETGNEHLDKGYDQVRRYFQFARSDRRSQLAVEYASIFLASGVFQKDAKTAVPYESVFTSEEHIMMQESRDDVVAWFLRDGFKVDPELHEPEDHLSFELEYLSDMNDKALQLVESKDWRMLDVNAARQMAFIDKHLLNWIPSLLEVARDYAKTTFYLGMLEIAIGSLEQSRAMLQEIQDQIHGVSAS